MGDERTNVVVTSTCTQVIWTFRNFPDVPNNSVSVRVTVGRYAPFVVALNFAGASSTPTTAIDPLPGTSRIETRGQWKFHGAQQGFDIHSRKVCAPAPSFSIEKLQKIAGASGEFTASPLTGKVGQTVDYEIVVKNTGNVPLTLSNFSDPNCEAGTLAGGPGEAALAPGPAPTLGASSTYTCSRALAAPGSYSNVASDTATPPPGDGSPITSTSNTVVVNVPLEPGFSIEKLQKIAGGSGGFTTSPLAGEVGQTIDYEIVVKNTGDLPLTFSNFSDPTATRARSRAARGSAARCWVLEHVHVRSRPERSRSVSWLLQQLRERHRYAAGRRGLGDHAHLKHGDRGTGRRGRRPGDLRTLRALRTTDEHHAHFAFIGPAIATVWRASVQLGERAPGARSPGLLAQQLPREREGSRRGERDVLPGRRTS